MLAIRMQRLGRKGHPTYRIVVQDVRQTPTSGKYVALLGSYDPHTNASTLVKEKAEFYLSNGAQPSERIVKLFQAEGITLPKWVKTEATAKTRTTRNPEKLRKNQPAVSAEEPKEAPIADQPATETEGTVENAETEAPAAEKPAETATEEVSEADTATEDK